MNPIQLFKDLMNLCDSCGRPMHCHDVISRSEVEHVWAHGMVLTICNPDYEHGKVLIVTRESEANPEDPCDIDFMKGIES